MRVEQSGHDDLVGQVDLDLALIIAQSGYGVADYSDVLFFDGLGEHVHDPSVFEHEVGFHSTGRNVDKLFQFHKLLL